MNSELYDKQYRLPSDIIKNIRVALTINPTGDGVRRAKFLSGNGVITYQVAKRIKHDLENINLNDATQKTQYDLAGGALMLSFINKVLGADRSAVKRGGEARQGVVVDTGRGMNPTDNRGISEGAIEGAIEGATSKISLNALAIIVNKSNKILLLKRSDYPDQWMPSKWSVVGGGINENEKPIDAAIREAKEETGLIIDTLIQKFVIKRNDNNIEYIFIGRYLGSDDDVKLDRENSEFGWCGEKELKSLDIVPNLKNYLEIAFKEY